MLVQAVEAGFPELAVPLDPRRRFGEGVGAQPARPLLPAATALDHRGTLKHFEVTGDRRQRDPERLGQLRDGRLPLGKAHDDGPPGGVRERGERGAELRIVCFDPLHRI